VEKDKDQLRAEKKAQKLDAKELKASNRREQKAKDLDMYGRQVASEGTTMGTISIYDKGYVKVGGVFLGGGKFEKLKSFEVFNNNLTKKTGFGRGATAVLTGGLNLLSPNTRGNIIVTIVTDVQVHTGELLPQVQSIRSINVLQAAANAVLDSLARAASPAYSQGESLSESLEKLVRLRDSGALSTDEFEKAKSKLLN
jgi:hypothetical protein